VEPNHNSKGLKGRPAGHTLSQFKPRLDGYVHMSIHMSILCLRVSGNQEEWSDGHVDGRLAIHYLQTNSIKSVEAPL
jgi:hypothetical protein